MKWLVDLHTLQPIAHAMLVLAGVAVLGLTLGSVKYRGVGLGIAGVLFAGIAFGHAGFAIDSNVLSFARDFGLMLFVYTIGMQVGPGFLTSLRRQGLPLNLMAAAIVLLGALIAVAISFLGNVDLAAMVGVFAGATTNTPALGAAQQALKSLPDLSAVRADLPALGYAVSYPFGVLGIILSMMALRALFRVDVARDVEDFRKVQLAGHEAVQRMALLVDNRNLDGIRLRDIPGMRELEIVVSRIKQAGTASVKAAQEDTLLRRGDVLLAVGSRQNLEKFRLIVGQESPLDLTTMPGTVTRQRVVVTRKEVLGKLLGEIGLNQRYGVTISRVTRADIEMTAIPELKLQFGDMLQVVGEKEAIANAARALGNSLTEVNHTNLIPIFVGLVLGILLGCYPISLAHMPAPVRLGLAGGPLLAAIFLSRIGKIGPLVWYMPVNANVVLRELGIVLFLSCVGLKAGERFFEVLRDGDGLYWMACGALLTVLPLLIVGGAARLFTRMNYVDLCGLLSGSMTDPPALAFANAASGSDLPSVAYATVYPMTMLLRIVVAQTLILVFCH